jgi:hypothetical protein
LRFTSVTIITHALFQALIFCNQQWGKAAANLTSRGNTSQQLLCTMFLEAWEFGI